jgi:hypothetical protein
MIEKAEYSEAAIHSTVQYCTAQYSTAQHSTNYTYSTVH